VLERNGFSHRNDFLGLGANKPGKRAIEGLLPESVTNPVNTANNDQVNKQCTEIERNKRLLSEVVIEEASRGDESEAANRLAALEGIEVLAINEASIELSKALIDGGAIPQKALDDALHVALASVNGIDFLLTWNCRHIDDAVMKPKIRGIVEERGLDCPEIATPIELMGVQDDG